MAKTKNSTTLSVLRRDLFNLAIYKPTQGKLARQLTALGLAVLVLAGLWTLSNQLVNEPPEIRYGIPIALAVVSGWVIFRLVNMPRFADFLISTEAEMNKVSWPTRPELFRATAVVLVTMVLLGAFLFASDLIWRALLVFLNVLQF